VGLGVWGGRSGEAVGERRAAGPAERAEVRVELPVNAHIPHSYVPGERLRLEAYTRIAAIDSAADITAVSEELTDRYGPLPEPVLGLLAVASLRAQARKAGLTDITQQGTHIRFAPADLPESRAGGGAAAVPEDGAQASGAYDARTGAQGRTWRPPRGAGPAGCPAPARQGAACLVRAAHRGGVRREQPGHAERVGHLRPT